MKVGKKVKDKGGNADVTLTFLDLNYLVLQSIHSSC